jgi:hypothetical protein
MVLDRKKLVGRLVEKQVGLSPIDLDSTGNGISFEKERDALVNPDSFCRSVSCSKDTAGKLGQAQTLLISFLTRHTRDPSPGGFDTSRVPITSAGLQAFLRGDPNGGVAYCVPMASSSSARTATDSPSSAAINLVPGHVALRQTVEDLRFPQDSEGFKGAKAATLSIVNDRIARKSSFSIDAALGYASDRISLDEEGNFVGQITPFATYNQKFVQTPDIKTSSRTQNVGVGVIGDMTFAVGGFYNNVAVYPKFVDSLSSRAQVASGNLVYTPEFGIPGIDNAYYIVPDFLAFQFVPKLKVIYKDVTRVGSNTELKNGSYVWIGPSLNFNLYGDGAFSGFTYNATYEGYRVTRGVVKDVSNFQTSIAYDLTPAKLASLQLKYERGRNLDTLEKVNQVTLGLGLKY